MTPPALRLMDALLISGPEGGHRESLMRQAEMSPTTFYRGLEPLLEMGVVVERRGHYTLPLSHPYNFAYKLWHDQARLLELPQRLRVELLSLRDKIHSGLGDNLLALWIHGSAAHQTMGDNSDIDLLAVLRAADGDFDVKGWREVQLTTLVVDDFREDYRHGDNFLRTILSHGLLIFDRGFAQEFYAAPFPAPVAGYRKEILERIQNRFSFFYREKALEDARKALSSLAVMVGRLLLEPFGVFPAGKPQLLDHLGLFLGAELTETFRRALAQDELNLKKLLEWKWDLESLLERFDKNVPYFQEVFRGLTGSSQEFESACYEMVSSVYPYASLRHKRTGEGIEMFLKRGGEEQAVCCKSTVGAFTEAQLVHLSTYRPLTLVLNVFRETPVERRPPLHPGLVEEAQRQGIVIEDSRALWSKFLVKTLVRAYYWASADALEIPIDHLTAFAQDNKLEWVANLQDGPEARAGYGELLEVQYGSKLKPGYYRFLAPVVLPAT